MVVMLQVGFPNLFLPFFLPLLSSSSYRLLLADHSVVGGEYTFPSEAAGQGVYTAFSLQQAAVLFLGSGQDFINNFINNFPGNPYDLSTQKKAGKNSGGGYEGDKKEGKRKRKRSLHVGLGAGASVRGLQRAGFVADAIELHAEVVEAAARWFGVRPMGVSTAADALVALPALLSEIESSRSDGYDVVIHDVFTGGGTAALLMSAAFFSQLRRALRADPPGVLAVNAYMYGEKDNEGLAAVQKALIHAGFASVRCFADEDYSDADADEDIPKRRKEEKRRPRPGNFVFFASDADLVATDVAAAAAAWSRGFVAAIGGEEMLTLADVQTLDVFAKLAVAEVAPLLSSDDAIQLEMKVGWRWPAAEQATTHWVAMRQQFGDKVWRA
jgi:hypothetical protein